MADRKLSASTELAVEPDVSDLLLVLDVSDTTDAATGTTKKMLWSTLKANSVAAASDVAAGKVELATAAETTTGTDAARAITPDGLAGSDFGKRLIEVKVMDDATALTIGDGKLIFCIPS